MGQNRTEGPAAVNGNVGARRSEMWQGSVLTPTRATAALVRKDVRAKGKKG